MKTQNIISFSCFQSIGFFAEKKLFLELISYTIFKSKYLLFENILRKVEENPLN